MPSKKISELTSLPGESVADDDLAAIVDTSAVETKKISVTDLRTAIYASLTSVGRSIINAADAAAQRVVLGVEKLLHVPDMFSDFVVSGLLSPTSTTLSSTLSAGTAYVLGQRTVVPATAYTYTANMDTYVDLANTGALTYVAVANTKLIEDCEDLWNESVDADVTVSLSTDSKVGTYSNKFVVAATAVAGDILATEAIAALDISTATHARFWIKSSVATAAGDLQLLLSESANAATPAETLNVPALAANTWTEVTVALASAAASRDAIISVGLKYAVDIGACDIYIDDIHAKLPSPTAPAVTADTLRLQKVVTSSTAVTAVTRIAPLRTLSVDGSGVVQVSGTATVTATASASGNSFRTIAKIGDATAGITQSGHAAPITINCGGLGSGLSTTALAINTNNAGAGVQQLELNRSKSDTVGAHALLADNDVLGRIAFNGSDGSAFAQGAYILSAVNGTPAANNMPTALRFGTRPGTAGLVERFTILANGNIGAGQTTPTAALHIKAGTTAAGTAPLKLTSGPLNTTAEAGAIEFETGDFWATNTGAVRKALAFVPTQADVTASRALNTSYTNTGNRSKQVMVTARFKITVAGGSATIQGKAAGAIASGLVGIQGGLLNQESTIQLCFTVAPGQAYQVDSAVTDGTATLGTWFETTF